MSSASPAFAAMTMTLPATSPAFRAAVRALPAPALTSV